MGSKVGAEKSAASKTGCDVETWRGRRAAGLLWYLELLKKATAYLEAHNGRND